MEYNLAKSKKKLILPLIAIMFIVAMFCANFFPANDTAEAAIGNDVVAYYGSNSVLVVDTTSDWGKLATLSSAYTFNGKTVVLNCDIDLAVYPFSKKFFGVFEGNGHTAYNARTTMFSEIGGSGVVRNLNFYNASLTQARALLTVTNNGTIYNVTASGNMAFGNLGGLVATNNGLIENCKSYLNICENTTSGLGISGGIAVSNYGTIRNSHYMGKAEITNSSRFGGIASFNAGLVEKCSAKIELVVNSIKSIDNMSVGGLVGVNGVPNNDNNRSAIKNGNAFIDVRYVSQEPINFSERALAVAGLIGKSDNTEMQYCYSDLYGEGELYGILYKTSGLQPIYQYVTPESPDTPYYEIIDYGFIGSAYINDCFSTALLQPDLYWEVEEGYEQEILPTTNSAITQAQLLNTDEDDLLSKINNDGIWQAAENQYPFLQGAFFDGAGTEEQPFIVADREDILLLQAFMYKSALSLYFLQTADIDFGLAAIAPLNIAMGFSGYYDGNDCVIYNFPATALFDKNFGQIRNLGFINGNQNNKIATNVGGTLSNCYTPSYRYGATFAHADIYGGRSFTLAETFGYTGVEPIVDITKDYALTGSGTQNDPYLIFTAAQLAGLSALAENTYAALANDIVVNSSAQPTKYSLNVESLIANLDGRGRSIIGLLNEPLVRTAITGSIKNVRLRGINISLDYTGMLCSVIDELGSAENITVYGSISGAESGGIAGENNGNIILAESHAYLSGLNSGGIAGKNNANITKSSFYGTAAYGIAAQGEHGSITHCFDGGGALMYDGGAVNSSLKANSSIQLIHNHVIEYESDILPVAQLRLFPQYDLSIWGYDYGNNICPTIKKPGKNYKEDIAQGYFASNLSYNRTYAPEQSLLISAIEHQLVINEIVRQSIVFEWLYNGVVFDPIESPYIVNAGTYLLNASFPGNDFVYQYTKTLTITIAKAPLPAPDFYGTGGILGVHTPYIYDGEDYDYTQIKAFNLDSVGMTEENYSYTLARGTTPVTYIRNVGYYTVSMTISSVNFTSFSGDFAVQVARANLNITMHDKTVNYLEEPPIYTFLSEAQTNSGATQQQIQTAQTNALAAIQTAGGAAVCAYTAGSNIGSYEISFAVTLTNYNVIVTKATLSVNAIPLPSQGIVFEDIQKEYEGEVIAIAAQLPEGVTASYINNNNRNVGSYTVQGIFSKPNYTDYTKEVLLTITAVELVIKPKDMQISYGALPPQYALDEIAFRGSDTAAVLSGQAVFEGAYIAGDDVGSYDILVHGLTAPNYNITFEKGILTVANAQMTDIFNYPDIELTYDGQQKTHPIDLLSYQTDAIYTYYLGEQLLAEAPTDSGVYTVAAYVTAINGNYANTQFLAQMTVNKADITVYFETEYTLEYDGQYHNISYEGELPLNDNFTIVQSGKNSANESFTSFKYAGRYNITTIFSGSRNYKDKTLLTVLNITKKELNLEITASAVYNKTNQTPSYVLDGVIDGDSVGVSWEYSLLGYGYEYAVNSVMNAGSYTTYPVSDNSNYQIVNNPVFSIRRLAVDYAPNYVEFVYGDYKDFVYAGRTYTSGRTFIIQRGFFVAETNESVDVEYYYAGPAAGIYNVTSVKDTPNFDFSIPEGAGTNRVTVQKRELTHSWNESHISVVYNGAIQQPFVLTIDNVVAGESVSTQIMSDGGLKNVGTYNIWAELEFSINYKLETQVVSLEITKAPLTIRANDKSVVRGTENINYTATVTGLRGTDTLSNMSRQLVYNCAYLPTSPVGLTLPITITPFELQNYEITFITGTLVVTPNEYPPMSMASRSFVYDGTVKSLSLNQALPQGATVSYQNNFKTQVGLYNVIATVIFPNSFMQTLTATLTITKATPVLFIQDIIMPYSVVAKLQNNDIIGVAMLNDIEVAGSFSWLGDTSLKRGINEYQVLFTPTDSHNFEEATTTVSVNGKPVREDALEFDTQSVILSDNNIYLTEVTNVTLTEEYADAELYLDGKKVSFITLAATGEYRIEIRYDGNTVFAKTFSVILQEDEEEPPIIPAGEGVFEISGGVFLENGVIQVEESQCFIRFKEGYEHLMLVQDGDVVSFILLYGNERSVKIQVVYDNIVVYSRSFNVVAPPEEEPPQRERDELLWLKVVGGIFGGGGAIVGLFFIIKKVIIKRRKVYNPYDAAEKRARKKK